MFLIISIISTVLLAYIISFYRNVKRHPPGPKPWPIVGNLLEFPYHRSHQYLCEQAEIYGNIFTIWLPRPYVCIMGHNEMKEAFAKDEFSGRMGLFPENVRMSVENGGVAFSSGESWRDQRRASVHILRDLGMGKNTMEEQVQESVARFLKQLDGLDLEAVDLGMPLQIMVQNVIWKMLFGFCFDPNDCERYKFIAHIAMHMVDEIKKSKLSFLAQPFPWIENVPYIGYEAVGRVKDFVQPMKDLVLEDIHKALEGYDITHEPDCFVQAYRQKMETDSSLNEAQLLNCCTDFTEGGIETTTTTLNWAMLFLAKYQDVQTKMRNEIRSVVGIDRIPSMNDRNRLPYTSAAVSEIQRLGDIVPMMVHRAMEEAKLGKFTLPKDTLIFGVISNVMKHSPVFKDPEEFRPERFLMDDGVTPNQETLKELIPFSVGKRRCAGEGIAKVEVFVATAAVLQKYKVQPLPGKEIDLEPEFSQVPKKQLLRLTRLN